MTKTSFRVPSYPISKIPTLVSPWNKKRIAANVLDISSYRKNTLRPFMNILNSYIFPMGIVVTSRGNHSQLSAILHGEGESRITSIIDLSPLYKVIKYQDGEFKYFHEEKWTSFLEILEQNSSHSSEYKKKILTLFQGDVGQLIGVLFEIGRFLVEKRAVPTSYFNPYKYL